MLKTFKMPKAVLMLALIAWLLPYAAHTHEIPDDVTVQVYLEPAGERLTALLRVPLSAMRDMDFAVRGPGYLDLIRIEPQLRNAVRLWLLSNLKLFADGRALEDPAIEAVRVALPGDQAFAAFDSARAAVYADRLIETTNLYWEQALLDVAIVYPIDSDQAVFEIEPSFARLGLRTLTQVNFLAPDGEIHGIGVRGNPGRLELQPGPGSVFSRFVSIGFEHVLDGLDHVLFVFMLVIGVLKIRPLLVLITAFTLAHSLTLAASLLDLVPRGLWFPSLVELLIAGSIFAVAVQVAVANRGAQAPDHHEIDRMWVVAFGFGLIHGFGFSFALVRSLQFGGEHQFISLLGFNLGVEFGQIVLLVVIVALLRVALRWVPQRLLCLILAALVGHTAWHWMIERWELFDAYRIAVPPFDVQLLTAAMRWLMLALLAVLLVWLLRAPFERWLAGPTADELRGRRR